MRHKWHGRKLGRTSKHRDAMTRNMVTSLIDEERVRTTLAKAKEVRRHAERIITTGKKGTLHARRQVASYLKTPAAVAKSWNHRPEICRGARYTEFAPLPAGDAAPMGVLELIAEATTRKQERQERRQKRKEAQGES